MKLRCNVCPNRCELEEGMEGICRARKNEDGCNVCLNYGKLTALALDPIEKKPLNRFYPGSYILSAGSFGCNMRCGFCQNHDISMKGEKQTPWAFVSPEELAQKAASLKNRGNIGVAYTYNEPCVGFEYVADTAKLVREAGMKNVLVTNGCVAEWVEDELLRWIDAMNIDLKGFTEQYYRSLGGNLETVKAFITKAAGRCHVELTTLIVPGENDGDKLDAMIDWIAAIDPEIPLHVSRFFPRWKMSDKSPTSIDTIYGIVSRAREKLKYVYAGNC